AGCRRLSGGSPVDLVTSGANRPQPGYVEAVGTGLPYGYRPYPAPRPTNGLAVASMILGVLWMYWLGSILALIFGYVARRQIRARGESGDGMAIAGIVLGWVGVGTLVAAIVVLIVVIVLATGDPARP